jgi:hypothetical protein
MSQQKIERVDNFINGASFFPFEDSKIDLPVWIGFGEPLIVPAEEVDPVGPDLTSMQAFVPGSKITVLSPPLRPRGHMDAPAIYSKVKSWMSQATNWPETLFDPANHPAWLRQSLELILQQYRSMSSPKDETCIFTTSLRLSLVLYVMGHALTVPKAHIPRLFSQLRHPDFKNATLPAGSHVIPRAINKCVKAILFPVVRPLVTLTCEHIHAQLGPKPDKSASFEAAFAASFLLLSVTAKTQTSLYERAKAGQHNNDPSFTLADAQRDILSMETELTQYVVHLFLLKYKPKKGKASARSPGSGSPSSSNSTTYFGSTLQAILQQEKEGIKAANQELGEGEKFDWELFKGSGGRNVTRVLARLCAPLIDD